jgi:hypothetical protein
MVENLLYSARDSQCFVDLMPDDGKGNAICLFLI